MTAYEFMRDNRGQYAVTEMAAVLGVSRAAFHKRARHGQSARRKEDDAALVPLILGIVSLHRRRYGSPRVRRELREVHGRNVSPRRVARLMRANGLNARRPRRRAPAGERVHALPVRANIPRRAFRAEGPGMKWVSDITYLRTKGGWVYLTVVIDLFDRKVLGWAPGGGMSTAQTSVAALRMAAANRDPGEALIFHSDRGVQYCAGTFRRELLRACPTARQSMSRKGNCQDDACAESFFASLKRELAELDGRHSVAEVRQAVFLYIEAYYNRRRMRSAIDYAAPDVFCLGKVA